MNKHILNILSTVLSVGLSDCILVDYETKTAGEYNDGGTGDIFTHSYQPPENGVVILATLIDEGEYGCYEEYTLIEVYENGTLINTFDVSQDIENELKKAEDIRLDRLCSGGHTCPSCGNEKTQHRDWGHGCGDLCYWCS